MDFPLFFVCFDFSLGLSARKEIVRAIIGFLVLEWTTIVTFWNYFWYDSLKYSILCSYKDESKPRMAKKKFPSLKKTKRTIILSYALAIKSNIFHFQHLSSYIILTSVSTLGM